MRTTQTEVFGTPFPAAFAAGWFWQQPLWQQQMFWQQQMYRLAYARAWSVLCGPQPARVRAAGLPRILRN